MRRFSLAVALALVLGPATATIPAQNRLQSRAGGAFDLSVDSIMRGPDLVGWPPTALRWSADSQQLYFDWRLPGEDESATYVVGRAGGQPRKLTDAEAKAVPPPNGRWDKAHKRVVSVDGGDIVLVDQAGVRRQSPGRREPNRTRAGPGTTPTSRTFATATSSSCRWTEGHRSSPS